jgi:hypothetical protein
MQIGQEERTYLVHLPWAKSRKELQVRQVKPGCPKDPQ